MSDLPENQSQSMETPVIIVPKPPLPSLEWTKRFPDTPKNAQYLPYKESNRPPTIARRFTFHNKTYGSRS
jgi:hypothetical protein